MNKKIKEELDNTFLEDLYEKTCGGNKDELTKIEVNELLKVLDEEQKHHLDNKNWNIINKQMLFILKQTFPNDKLKQKELYNKLKQEYRYVDEIHELDKGKFVRWIRENDGFMVNGAFVCNITTGFNGIIVSCINTNNKIMSYNFNKNISFQKLTVSEKIILEVKDFIMN